MRTNYTIADWDRAFAQLPPPRQKAGLIYLQVGPWSPWMRALFLSAAANPSVAFYFLGPPLDEPRFNLRAVCPHNCAWLPLDDQTIKDRVLRNLLNTTRRPLKWSLGRNEHKMGGRKLADMKPLWPALVPELSARHHWIGYVDSDVLLGNVSNEVEHLHDDVDVLVPAAFYPEPIANGNFMLMRSTDKMLYAFKRGLLWQPMLHRIFEYFAFDEWGQSHPWGEKNRPSMLNVFMDMWLGGELLARPTRGLLIQDVVVKKGMRFPRIDQMAQVAFYWRHGSLVAEREGLCNCPNDDIRQFGLSVCAECLKQPGARLLNVTHRRLEVFGVHFQEFKKQWRQGGFDQLRKHNGIWPPGSYPVAPCILRSPEPAAFDLTPGGFRCSNGSVGSLRHHYSAPFRVPKGATG